MRNLLNLLLTLTIFVFGASLSHAQTYIEEDGGLNPFIGTSAFIAYNLIPDDEPPAFAQLNFGIRLSPKDTILFEAITWQYFTPLGIQYWDSGDKFPGKIRDFGVGLGYQRYLWKGAYTAFHAMPFVQQYIDPKGEVIQTGFQLFLTLRFGYHFSFFDDLFFIEPNIAFTAWPFNTNAPASFQEQEDKWPSYFLAEPGFHIGFNF